MRKAFLAVLLLAGCGQSKVRHLDNSPPAPVVDTTRFSTPDCKFAFPESDLCADVAWVKEPTADAPLESKLVFWSRKKGMRSAALAPVAKPTAYFVMKCCKTPTDCPLEFKDHGFIPVGVKLIPGEYWLYVQVGLEKAAIDVEVN